MATHWKVVTLRLNSDMYNELNKRAQINNLNLSNYLRFLIGDKVNMKRIEERLLAVATVVEERVNKVFDQEAKRV